LINRVVHGHIIEYKLVAFDRKVRVVLIAGKRLSSSDFTLNKRKYSFFTVTVISYKAELRFVPHPALGIHKELEFVVSAKPQILHRQLDLQFNFDQVADQHHEFVADLFEEGGLFLLIADVVS
jgi:hypothetical protein